MLLRVIIVTAIMFAFCCSICYARKNKDGLRIICAFLVLTLISEAVAFYMASVYKNNMAVFHIFNPVLFMLIAYYLNTISAINRKYNIGLTLGLFGLVASVANTLLLQPLHTFNSNYLLLEGLFICILGFITLYDFERDDKQLYPHKNPHFWMAVLLVFKQVIVFSLYIVIHLFDRLEITDIAEAGVRVTYYILWGIGVLGYLLMGVIFLSFSKIHQR